MAAPTHTHVSHDTHSTTSGGAWSTQRIATTALLCALAFVLTFVEVSIFPPAPWLQYDPSAIVAFVAALVYGPSTGALVVVLPWVLKTLFSFNPWGHLMAILAGVALVVPATLIARRVGGTRGLVLGMVAGSVIAVAACVVGNIFVTPLYTDTTVEVVIQSIVPILLPFNLLKVVITSVATALIHRPVSALVNR